MKKVHKHSEESKRKMSEAKKGNQYHLGSKHSKETRCKISENHARSWKGKFHSTETKQKMSEAAKGRTFTAETLQKMRISASERLQGQGYVPSYNPEACKIIEEYGRKHGYNFQHAENGSEFHIKELGYWVDGYDKEKNVVIEYDESKHYINGELREKDVIRQKEIEKYLGCQFIRIKE